ncbi:MAG TPA: bifunctional oligoribonuclease/PAP phosphatase NrnA, partial [Candidatus Kapabacteria bacterium]|nr:bifunctional oligoribonuclease/PAP phosphatase NrnA [Candidatus Kapabacteria bacterium]
MIDWNSFADVFRGHENFVLTTHVNPDGDGLGTEIALGLCLQQIRKNVRIINYSETPKNYTFLNTQGLAFERFNESVHASVIAEADGIVVIDMNDEAR